MNQVEYLLIGGYAVVFFGYPGSTGDIDIWINKEPRNLKKIMITLKDFGFNPESLNDNDFWLKYNIIRMGIPPLRIEIHSSISGVIFDDCFNKKIEYQYEDLIINVISKDDLKRNKKASNRYKDLNDLENLN